MDHSKLQQTDAVVLAGGDPHRFPADQPAAIQRIRGAALVHRQLEFLRRLGISKSIVISHLDESLLDLPPVVELVRERKANGSGAALLNAAETLSLSACHYVLVLYAERPCFQAKTIERLAEEAMRGGAACSLTSVRLTRPFGYARIIRDEDGRVQRLVRDCEIKSGGAQLKEVVAGAYFFEKEPLLEALRALAPRAVSELYISDVVTHIAATWRVAGLTIGPAEALAVYSQLDLDRARAFLVR